MKTIASYFVSILLLVSTLYAMHDHLPPLPKIPSLRNAPPTLHFEKPLHTHNYAFGLTAAKNLEEALGLGFLKNEHPYKYNQPLISLEIGHCVIVPRSDNSFSYGLVTEIINPTMVCVACDKKSKDKNSYTIKIIASNNLYLRPEWLNLALKDSMTLTQYTKATQQSEPLPNLRDEESYEQIPKVSHKKISKIKNVNHIKNITRKTI